MLGIYRDVLPSSGVEFAVFLRLNCLSVFGPSTSASVTNLVVGRNNRLRIYDVRRTIYTEETHVESDLKSSGPSRHSHRLCLVREHLLHGIIIGLAAVRTANPGLGSPDRLLVSFQDSKLALMEWSNTLYDISTVSIHSYERSPLLLNSDFTECRAYLRTDPANRCAALVMPRDNIALLPWYQPQTELDVQDGIQSIAEELPYSPSYVTNVSAMDERIRNILDLVFLPGFNVPTIAILFQEQRTWTGRLKENKDNTSLFFISLDLVSRSYQVIATIEKLPYDSLYMSPCHAKLGGVLVVTANSILHVDQASKITTLPMSGWAARVSDTSHGFQDAVDDIHLEGSRMGYISDSQVILSLSNGKCLHIRIDHEGRTVWGLTAVHTFGISSPPSVLIAKDGLVFLGSTAGDSVLFEYAQDLSSHRDFMLPNASETIPTSFSLLPVDNLQDSGSYTAASFFGLRGSEEPALIAANGLDDLGGFSTVHKTMPLRLRKKLPAIAGRQGIWSMRVHQGNGIELPLGHNTLLSTDATPTPGASRIATKSQARLDINITTRIPMLTIAVAPFFDGTHLLQVTSNSLRLLTTDGSEKQVIPDRDNSTARARIRHAAICDPYVLILREDDTLGLFVGEPTRGKLRRKDMSPLGDKKLCYWAATFYDDLTGRLKIDEDLMRETKAVGNRGEKWLALCRSTGTLEIWSLPKLALVFVSSISLGPSVLKHDQKKEVDSATKTELPVGATTLQQVIITDLGEIEPSPHLIVLYDSNLLIVYQMVPLEPDKAGLPQLDRRSVPSLRISFVKRMVHHLANPTPDENQTSGGSNEKRLPKTIVPFSVLDWEGNSIYGAFVTGDNPAWILSKNHSGLLHLPCGYEAVHSFTPCSMWDFSPTFLMSTEEGSCLVQWTPGITFHGQYPCSKTRKGRTQTNIAYSNTTGLLVAASSNDRDFLLFDEEGTNSWEPDGVNVSLPKLGASALELLDPETWVTIDGYEFAANEVVNIVESVKLETLSTQTGNKEFIAVGTSIHRGEDLAVRGGTYIFEIAEVIQDTEERGRRRHRLKLLCKDEAKGPVTAVCGMNGYLVSSMGQKIFVRAFDLDERLVGVAFLDAGVYVTSIRCLKNLLVITDAIKGVWFVAFQEDPFKLVILSKEVRPTSIPQGDFFFAHNDMELLTIDLRGVLRLHSYDPTHVDTEEGARLLCSVEFQTHVEPVTIVRVAMEQPSSDSASDASRLLIPRVDGSLASLSPLDMDIFKRLYLLQAQLVRHTHHIAALNPKAYRAVQGSSTTRTMSRRMLDFGLLVGFKKLSFDRQQGIANQIGETWETLIRDCTQLEAAP